MNTKQEKFNLRWTAQQEQLIRDAANIKQKSVSAFILDLAYEGAQKVIEQEGQYRFSLSEKEWQEFSAALDAPPKRTKSLENLMNQPSVFEKGGK